MNALPNTAPFLPLPIFGGVAIYGGPYPRKPHGFVGVKMAAEIDLPCEISVPTKDYQTPDPQQLESGLLQAVGLLAKGEHLYVGCMGGIGRTGLFMACLAKAAGIEHPIEWVRRHYNEHAVETQEQMIFVQQFDTQRVEKRLRKLGAFPEPALETTQQEGSTTPSLATRARNLFSR